jgi:hypothetical protein
MNLLICKKAEKKLRDIAQFLLYFFGVDNEDNTADVALEFLDSVESQTIGAGNINQLDGLGVFQFV